MFGIASKALSRSSLASGSQALVCASAPSLGATSRRYVSRTAAANAEVTPGPPLSQTNKAELSLRRFWKSVNLASNTDGDVLVKLDQRDLKTPGGAKLIIPSNRRLLALLIANEWENQSEVLKQHSLPVTSLASRAIDGLRNPDTRDGVMEALMAYLETDTICFQEDSPRSLVAMQTEHWDPLFQWVKEEFGVQLALAEGLSPAYQSEELKAKLKQVLAEMDVWELAAFERAVYASKSFIIALALCRGRLTAEQASQASHVEVRSQIAIWGEVEDTHDVDYQDIRRGLGSAACLLLKA